MAPKVVVLTNTQAPRRNLKWCATKDAASAVLQYQKQHGGATAAALECARSAAPTVRLTMFTAAPECAREPSARAPTAKEYRKSDNIASLVWFMI